MKIVKPSHEILIPESPYKHIERIGRICYKSEDSITDISAEPFCKRMVNSGHHAMIEHYRFIIKICRDDYYLLKNSDYNKYITFTSDNNRYIISASARGLQDMFIEENNEIIKDVLIDLIHFIIRTYDCKSLFNDMFMEIYTNECDEYLAMTAIKNFNELSDNEYLAHAWYSVHFVCDRGVSHELVRHRDASFAQESTRYCNYGKGKFGNEITAIDPFFFNEDKHKYERYAKWKAAMDVAELAYLQLLGVGATPQEARTVLPNSLKTEIVVTAQVYEWLHIFDLRVLGTTGKPHPQMIEVMKPVRDEMIERGFIE